MNGPRRGDIRPSLFVVRGRSRISMLETIPRIWAATAARLPGASTPLTKFGASDCCCETHLYHFKSYASAEAFADLLGPGVHAVRACD